MVVLFVVVSFLSLAIVVNSIEGFYGKLLFPKFLTVILFFIVLVVYIFMFITNELRHVEYLNFESVIENLHYVDVWTFVLNFAMLGAIFAVNWVIEKRRKAIDVFDPNKTFVLSDATPQPRRLEPFLPKWLTYTIILSILLTIGIASHLRWVRLLAAAT